MPVFKKTVETIKIALKVNFLRAHKFKQISQMHNKKDIVEYNIPLYLCVP